MATNIQFLLNTQEIQRVAYASERAYATKKPLFIGRIREALQEIASNNKALSPCNHNPALYAASFFISRKKSAEALRPLIKLAEHVCPAQVASVVEQVERLVSLYREKFFNGEDPTSFFYRQREELRVALFQSKFPLEEALLERNLAGLQESFSQVELEMFSRFPLSAETNLLINEAKAEIEAFKKNERNHNSLVALIDRIDAHLTKIESESSFACSCKGAIKEARLGNHRRVLEKYLPHLSPLNQLYCLHCILLDLDYERLMFTSLSSLDCLDEDVIEVGYEALMDLMPEHFAMYPATDVQKAFQKKDFDSFSHHIFKLLDTCSDLPDQHFDEKLKRYWAAKTIYGMFARSGSAFVIEGMLDFEDKQQFHKICSQASYVTLHVSLRAEKENSPLGQWLASRKELARRVIALDPYAPFGAAEASPEMVATLYEYRLLTAAIKQKRELLSPQPFLKKILTETFDAMPVGDREIIEKARFQLQEL